MENHIYTKINEFVENEFITNKTQKKFTDSIISHETDKINTLLGKVYIVMGEVSENENVIPYFKIVKNDNVIIEVKIPLIKEQNLRNEEIITDIKIDEYTKTVICDWLKDSSIKAKTDLSISQSNLKYIACLWNLFNINDFESKHYINISLYGE